MRCAYCRRKTSHQLSHEDVLRFRTVHADQSIVCSDGLRAKSIATRLPAIAESSSRSIPVLFANADFGGALQAAVGLYSTTVLISGVGPALD
jgi:hypothetical protein